jgi:hypothetical protein
MNLVVVASFEELIIFLHSFSFLPSGCHILLLNLNKTEEPVSLQRNYLSYINWIKYFTTKINALHSTNSSHCVVNTLQCCLSIIHMLDWPPPPHPRDSAVEYLWWWGSLVPVQLGVETALPSPLSLITSPWRNQEANEKSSLQGVYYWNQPGNRVGKGDRGGGATLSLPPLKY